MNRMLRAACAAAVGAAVVLGGAATGHAATTETDVAVYQGDVSYFSGSNCPADSLCLYRDYGYTGGGLALRAGASIDWLGDYNFNDMMSSWSNDSGTTCQWFSDAYFEGDQHVMYDRYRIEVPLNENDTASSVTCW